MPMLSNGRGLPPARTSAVPIRDNRGPSLTYLQPENGEQIKLTLHLKLATLFVKCNKPFCSHVPVVDRLKPASYWPN